MVVMPLPPCLSSLPSFVSLHDLHSGLLLAAACLVSLHVSPCMICILACSWLFVSLHDLHSGLLLAAACLVSLHLSPCIISILAGNEPNFCCGFKALFWQVLCAYWSDFNIHEDTAHMATMYAAVGDWERERRREISDPLEMELLELIIDYLCKACQNCRVDKTGELLVQGLPSGIRATDLFNTLFNRALCIMSDMLVEACGCESMSTSGIVSPGACRILLCGFWPVSRRFTCRRRHAPSKDFRDGPNPYYLCSRSWTSQVIVQGASQNSWARSKRRVREAETGLKKCRGGTK